MIVYMIDTRGRERIAQFVKRAIAWNRTSAVKVGAMPGSPSRETIQRIVKGEEVSEYMLMALGDKLQLPRDFLLYVGAGDVKRVENSGADPDLIRWTVDLIEADPPQAGSFRTAR